MSMAIERCEYGVTKDGKAVEQFRLRNRHQVEVSIITFGGIVTSFVVPNGDRKPVDIVLGYDTLQQYEACGISVGCIVGRYANRIADAKFSIDGKHYELEANNHHHHLHGGNQGFNKVVWAAEINPGTSSKPDELILSHTSEDGHGGYPGSVSVRVGYSLTDNNELVIQYSATTDKPTVLNLTNHSYFNLLGHQNADAGGALQHQLKIAAEQFIPTANQGIPLDHFCDVQGTPMDFRTSTTIGDNAQWDYPQLVAGNGYDHTWVLGKHERKDHLAFAACLSEVQSGRRLEVHTTQPGVQFYTANHVKDCPGKSGVYYQPRGAVCLETQHFPNSPNRPEFPSTVLRPGERYRETTVYRVDI